MQRLETHFFFCDG